MKGEVSVRLTSLYLLVWNQLRGCIIFFQFQNNLIVTSKYKEVRRTDTNPFRLPWLNSLIVLVRGGSLGKKQGTDCVETSYTWTSIKELMPLIRLQMDSILIHTLIFVVAFPGFSASTCTNPIWLIKTRLQLDKSSGTRTLTIRHCAAKIYTELVREAPSKEELKAGCQDVPQALRQLVH